MAIKAVPRTDFLSSGRGSLAMLSMVEGLTGMFSSFQTGKAERELAKSNAFIARLKSKDAKARGQEAESISRGKTKKAVASQKASMASQGLNLSVGSPVDVVTETEDVGAMDALTIKNNAIREAMGHDIEGIRQTGRGKIKETVAKSEGFSSFLSGGTKGISQYDKWRRGV